MRFSPLIAKHFSRIKQLDRLNMDCMIPMVTVPRGFRSHYSRVIRLATAPQSLQNPSKLSPLMFNKIAFLYSLAEKIRLTNIAK